MVRGTAGVDKCGQRFWMSRGEWSDVVGLNGSDGVTLSVEGVSLGIGVSGWRFSWSGIK